VAPAGSEDTGGEDISRGASDAEYNIGELLILALDTTSRSGSVAVVHDDEVRVELAGDVAVTHGQRLPLELKQALDQAAVTIDGVDLFAVVAGPGSFTGLRVGIATIQGLAMAEQKKVVALSALEVLARAAINPQRPIGVWIDAQRGEVFAALYSPDGRGLLIEAVSARPDDVLDAWSGDVGQRDIAFIGDGAVHYRDTIVRRGGAQSSIAAPPPLAGLAGRIAAAEPSRAILPHAIVPVYVRKSDAELARARREQAAR
jgi:tRNA threonylcarbamoyladenosine biosynthesis protein TsaB